MAQNHDYERYNVSIPKGAISAFSSLITLSLFLGVLGVILAPLIWILLLTRTDLLHYFFFWQLATINALGLDLVNRQVAFFGTFAVIIPLGAAITGHLGYQMLPVEERHWPAWLGGTLGGIFTFLSVVCLLGTLIVLWVAGLGAAMSY